jgi:hypothetical protein
VIDWEALGGAVKETCGVDNVVLEFIREENPVHEFKKAAEELRNRGWDLGR